MLHDEIFKELKLPTTHKIVFVCGLHRSGTSLLHNCLRDHPQVSGFQGTGVLEDEGQHLQSVYPPGKVHGGPGQFGFNPRTFLNEHSALVSGENAAKLFREWGAYWDLGKPVLLEKSPPNLIRTRFLQALFPEAYFIVLLRHPVAVSFATQKWSNTEIPSLLEHWLICHERFDLDRKFLRRVLTVKYEDFMRNPQAILDSIGVFCGIEPVLLSQQVRQNLNDTYFEKWCEYREQARSSIPDYYFEHLLERRFMHFGYSLLDSTKCEPY